MVANVGTDANDSLGQRIKRARKARDWTLEKLANEIGVSAVTVWSWERDRTKPRIEKLDRLTTVLAIATQSAPTNDDDSGQPMSELIARFQSRIANAVGVEKDAVEIKITFGRAAA